MPGLRDGCGPVVLLEFARRVARAEAAGRKERVGERKGGNTKTYGKEIQLKCDPLLKRPLLWVAPR